VDPWRWVDPRVREVKPAGVRAYFARRGYSERTEAQSLRFESAGGPAFELPASELDEGFTRSLVELLTTLSEAEGRHPVALLDEMLSAQARKPGLRLLWVENHATFARMAGRQFLSAHELTVVPTLAAARAALEASAFDAVLLDHDLDDGKGTSLIEFVAQLRPPPVVIATSAHEAGNRALLAAGARAVCSKTKFAQIDAVLREAMGASSQARP
jgi:CheY-like chemotaxis protein